uniref:Putative Site-specific DNA-methyltransferase (Adenine-specific) n=1 Tax=mine drainage metagenome TaxID=410659 RepID=E6QRI8_9ZZZZ
MTHQHTHTHAETHFPDTESLITVRDWVRFGVSQMNRAQLAFGHGSQNAWDEAIYLILHTLHLPLDNLEPFLDASLTEPERTELESVLHQRIHRRIPAAYLTHEAWLGEFSFYVDERVIIPRSFIAELLQQQLAPWVDDPECLTSALDLCTGSGCLAVLMAHAFPNADIDALDLSTEALAVAQQNIQAYGLQEQVRLIQSDLFEKIDRQYDLIITNPPYVNATSMAELPAEYRTEPELALASGEDGLQHIRPILRHAAQYLFPGGLLVAEIGHNRDALEAEFPQIDFTWLESGGSDEYVFLLTKAQLDVL